MSLVRFCRPLRCFEPKWRACPIALASCYNLGNERGLQCTRFQPQIFVNLFDRFLYVGWWVYLESASVKIFVVKTVLKWDSSSLHSLTKQRDSGLSDNDFMATTPILLEPDKISCLRRNMSFL